MLGEIYKGIAREIDMLANAGKFWMLLLWGKLSRGMGTVP